MRIRGRRRQNTDVYNFTLDIICYLSILIINKFPAFIKSYKSYTFAQISISHLISILHGQSLTIARFRYQSPYSKMLKPDRSDNFYTLLYLSIFIFTFQETTRIHHYINQKPDKLYTFIQLAHRHIF